MMDPRVTVAIGDEEVAVWADGEIRRIAERPAGSLNRAVIHSDHTGIRGLAARAERHLQRSVRREGANAVIEIVGAVDGVVGANEDAVRPFEEPLAPGGKERAFAIEDHHRRRAAREKEDAIFRIAGDADHFTM